MHAALAAVSQQKGWPHDDSDHLEAKPAFLLRGGLKQFFGRRWSEAEPEPAR